MDRYTVAQTVGLYEVNYQKLMRLFSRLEEMEGSCILMVDAVTRIRLDIVENNRYTKIIDLGYDTTSSAYWFNQPKMRLRVYHDAEVVEVVSYQQHLRFKARYDYPNEKMLNRHEKRIVNLFLGEWLDHCQKIWRDALEAQHVSSLS